MSSQIRPGYMYNIKCQTGTKLMNANAHRSVYVTGVTP